MKYIRMHPFLASAFFSVCGTHTHNIGEETQLSEISLGPWGVSSEYPCQGNTTDDMYTHTLHFREEILHRDSLPGRPVVLLGFYICEGF